MTDTVFLVAIGAKIKETRLQKNLTQSDLAIQCNFEKASMSRIEAGKTNMTVLTLLKICLALEIEIVELFRA